MSQIHIKLFICTINTFSSKNLQTKIITGFFFNYYIKLEVMSFVKIKGNISRIFLIASSKSKDKIMSNSLMYLRWPSKILPLPKYFDFILVKMGYVIHDILRCISIIWVSLWLTQSFSCLGRITSRTQFVSVITIFIMGNEDRPCSPVLNLYCWIT